MVKYICLTSFFLSFFCLKCTSQTFNKSAIFKYVPNNGVYGGNHIGGVQSDFKPSYDMKIAYDFKVTSVKGLLEALRNAKAGQVVFVDGTIELELSNAVPLNINAGVTLMSDRGRGGSHGALLKATKAGVRPMIKIGGKNTKIIGLRIYGGDSNIYPNGKKIIRDKNKRNTYGRPVTEGISSKYSNLEIGNCEISGWSHAGIFISDGASDINIHHNYIHGNKRHGLGYGVALKGASATIQANLFENNRHDVAGTGEIGTSYYAHHNIVIGDKDDHLFDMHGGKDRKDNTNIAGTSINISNNYFYTRKGTRAIVIRGIPQRPAIISGNIILQSAKEVESISLRVGVSSEQVLKGFIGQRNSFGNIEEKNNRIISIH
ncbi:DUF1565 domain-containing protein [Sphingobacterium shayense]|uniref:DUF1565 domain-containing protein n=1 Tax=Sphingobacterium shayense TaxID=626343 RepID=UPI00155559E0|nr:DUF1565 domain-containing protein [Sphingobacterium shayense]NQD70233.1 DUF1565 domain-containing protein [Sphingobacterium shayense]